ncbi:MAG TPA: LptF/LptG family permease [Planctomycetaceae bacterium]|nr:LptF/LptG family permease [Planctomycetaceae bacterium]
MRTEVNTRFAMATSCFFFVLVGSPFAILMARKQFLTSFLFCFLPILVIYYPVAMMSQNLSKTGMVDPTWAVWSANALLLTAGGICIRRVLQN